MAKLIITVESDDITDLDFLRARLDGAVEDVLIENEDRFDGQVWHEIEMADD